LIRQFIVFEVDGPTVHKKLAGYHQYHAANKAVDCTVRAASRQGDRRVGVIWHIQGSGKSLTMAFYDALEVNDSALKVLGDETLRTIAREPVDAVRKCVTIDWAVKESSRAQMRTIVRRLLRKYGYPPDKQEKATQTVIEQAELLCRNWAA